MNLEPVKPDTEVRTQSGVARTLASLTIMVLATITILVVLEVIPRSAFAALAGKTAMIAGICAITALAIGLLQRR